MQQIPLQALPNQSFQIVLDNNTWAFTIKTTGGLTTVSLTLNNVDILDSTPAVAGGFIIPYEYLEAGNFFFTTQNYQLPNYEYFGTTQYLIYISATELAAYRAAPSSPFITTASFNPIAPLPLRFAPVGYVAA